VQAAADSLGQPVRIFSVGSDREIDAAFATIIDQRISGLLVQADQFFTGRCDQPVLVTTRHAIPTIFGWREFAIAGGLRCQRLALFNNIVGESLKRPAAEIADVMHSSACK
jgi:putative tryptophan/tyrosine transport system substrate-binding protein